MIIGLTGGIGSGKSAAAALFEDIGVDLIDADDLARDSLSINSEGYKLFIEEFGDKYLDENKNIKHGLYFLLIGIIIKSCLRVEIIRDFERIFSTFRC